MPSEDVSGEESVQGEGAQEGDGEVIYYAAPHQDHNYAADQPSSSSSHSDESSPSGIKAQALYFIEELQDKKKCGDFPLICKICRNRKKFTAKSSLVNHYCSHGGIKQFKCEICKQKFTRRHTLKYHMMIHRGQYVYTCQECQSKFRHRGHLKEHLRIHTGETPFHCEFCDRVIGFKSRNTYKNHLKTHHGYILTKNSMLKMSDEEFAKVRTRRYKKPTTTSPRQHDEKSPTSSGSTSAEP